MINGKKSWITSGPVARYIVLFAISTPGIGAKGVSAFIIDTQKPGFHAGKTEPKLGIRASATCEIEFNEYVCPKENLLGDEGKGFSYLLDGLNAERVLVAAEAVGVGKVALRRAVEYAKSRVVFGRPIGANQGISFPLAEAHARLAAAELATRQAAWRIDNNLPSGEHANMAKFLAADAAFAAADAAVQTHGGFGYASEYHVERYWRESRLMRIAPIPQEMVLNYLAEHVLGLPRSY